MAICFCELSLLPHRSHKNQSRCHQIRFSEREVDSRSRSLYVVVRPSCLSSVTFVRPTQWIEIFGNVSTPFGTLAIYDLSIKIFTEIVPGGTPSLGALNRRGVAKFSDFGPIQDYISQTVQDRR